MGKASRRKGAAAEREVAKIIEKHGFTASRTARNGLTSEDVTHTIPGVWLEVKRRETLALPAWTRQAEKDAQGREPVVVYRQSGQPWRASISFDRLVQLLAIESDIQNRVVPSDKGR